MSLQNLVGVSLEQITPQKQTVRRLLDGATRHIFNEAKVLRLKVDYTGVDIGTKAAKESVPRAEVGIASKLTVRK
jgi:hypothetical protein